MNIKSYIKDHLPILGIWGISVIVTQGILLLFHGEAALQVFILAVEITGVGAAVGYDYGRKQKFYAHMKGQLEGLKEKYLLMEMVEKPEFLEGQIFYSTMEEMEKSMNDEIFEQIRKNNEFKRYVETWVHEVKLPIASIRLLLHDYRGENSRALKEQTARVESYVEQVLYFLRSEVPEKDYVIQEYSLKDLTNQVIGDNKDSLILNHIKMIQETEDIAVCTDEKWMKFMTGQILSNAVKYKREENPVIRLWSEVKGRAVVLHIWDNGMGIEEQDLPRVFEKSFTGQNGRVRQSSTGMGLYLCSMLSKRLGHRLEIRSVHGEYTELTITFQGDCFLEVVKQDNLTCV